jgi:hypothetical protein
MGLANVTIAFFSVPLCFASRAGGAVHLATRLMCGSTPCDSSTISVAYAAAQCEMEANVRFTKCEFSGNSAQSGAAAFIADGASPVFDKWTSRATAPPWAAPCTWTATRGTA